MSQGTDDLLTALTDIRSIVGEPNPATFMKLLDSLDETAIDYVRRSPFLVLATADRGGRPDVSPKGDRPGFVAVEDDRTLLIPDRRGNRLIFGIQNILENSAVAIIFMIPGTEETLRIRGHAELTADPEILGRLSAPQRPALLAIRVTVEKCFLHCAKAFKRSQLWQAETWPPQQRISFGKQIAAKLGGGAELAQQIDEVVAADYKENL